MIHVTVPEILLYHRVADTPVDNQYLSVNPENFEEHLAVLSMERKVLPLFDLVQAAHRGHLVEGGVAITFDDGYADNLLNALPLLEKYRCHATIFVTAGLLGNAYGFWYDVLEDVFLTGRALPPVLHLPVVGEDISLGSPEEVLVAHDVLLDACRKASPRLRRLLLHEIVQGVGMEAATYVTSNPLLTSEQVRELAASPWIEVGAHTLTHPVLAELDESAQKREICDSVHVLTELTGKRTRMLAYPFGNRSAYSPTTCRITKDAELLGISNVQGGLSLPLDLQNVPRRLVRNWSGAQFRQWLHNTDKDQLERATLADRKPRLLQILQASATFAVPPRVREGVNKSKNMLRITHINTSLGKGGAAGVMQLLQELQQNASHESAMLVGMVNKARSGGSAFDTAPDLRHADDAQRNGLPDYHFLGSHSLALHPQVQQADVLHLHNLHGGYFNPWSLPGIARQRPTVWTLHDMQALTGHCAHAYDCTRWQTGCGLCPDLHVYVKVSADNTHRIWRDKQRLYSCAPLHLVTPSHWLGNYVKKSILAEHRLTVIPNGIDTKIFAPRDKAALRAKLGISPHTLVVGSAAHGGPLHNGWKGGSFALEALEALRERHPDVLFLGRGNEQQACMPNVRLLPYAHSEDEMADFYSVLDIMLYPSLADNCPLVVMEAMACGVPVLAFGVGGIPELVDDDCGVLVPPRDGIALSRAVLEMAAHPGVRQNMSQSARRKAESCFDARLMAQRYESLYEEVRREWHDMPQMQNSINITEVPAWVRTSAFMKMAEQSRLFQNAMPQDGDAVRTEPVSRLFGLDRGKAIDRVYIENFLHAHRERIGGRVLEIGSNTYTKQFGAAVTRSDVLNVVPCDGATIVGSLEDDTLLPDASFDCIIFTQTLHVIFEIRTVLKNLGTALAPGGVLLLTAPCISQISRYDMDRWGDYWRFTDKGLRTLLESCIAGSSAAVRACGNLAIAKAFLDGRAAEEIPSHLFQSDDADYQVLLAACVTKSSSRSTVEFNEVYHKTESSPRPAAAASGMQHYYPTQLAIEPVRGCNARCIMCPQKSAKRPGGILKTGHLTLMLEKVKQWGAPISLISHAGLGEPLLDKDLEKKVARDKAIFPKATVAVYSNGGLLSHERSIRLLESGVDVLSFSVNALHDETYARITGLVRDKVYKNILELVELREKMHSKTVINVSCIPIAELPAAEVAAFRKFWHAKVDAVVVPPVINWGGDWGEAEPEPGKRFPCNYIFSVLMVDWDGTVKRCCEDYDSKYPMGNLLEQDPHAIFNSPMMVAQRRAQLQGTFSQPYLCRRCVETSPHIAGEFWDKGGGIPC